MSNQGPFSEDKVSTPNTPTQSKPAQDIFDMAKDKPFVDKIVDSLLEEVATFEPNYYLDEEKINQCLKNLGSLKQNPRFIDFALNKLFNIIQNSTLKTISIDLFHLAIKRSNQIYFFLYHLGAPLKVENGLHHELLKMLIHELGNAVYLFGLFYLQGGFKEDEILVLYPRNTRYKNLLEKTLTTQQLFSAYLFSGETPLSEEILVHLKEKNDRLKLSTFCAKVSYLRTERDLVYRDNPRLTQAHAINVNGHLAQILKRKETLSALLPKNKMLDNLADLKKATHLDIETDAFYEEIALARLEFEEIIVETTIKCFCDHESLSNSCHPLLKDLDAMHAKVSKLLQYPPLQKEKLLDSHALYADITKTFHLAVDIANITTSDHLYRFIEKLTKLCQAWDSLFDSHAAIWIALGHEITQLNTLSAECAKFLKNQNQPLTKTSAPPSAGVSNSQN